MEERDNLFKKGEKAARIGFLVVAFTGAAKTAVALITGSISLLAQSVDSLTDLFSLVAVFIGIRLANKPPSERFQYGYYRVETLASLLIAILILLTGTGLLGESLLRLTDSHSISHPTYAVGIALSSIPILYLLHKYTKRVGEEINSQALQNQAADFKSDIYSSFLVVVGVGASAIGYPFLEHLVGILISLQILKTGAYLSWQALLVLMDAVTHPERVIQIKNLAEEVSGVREAYNIRIRQSGPFCLGELTIGIDRQIHVDQAHRITENVDSQIKKEMPFIESLAIHIEPQERKKLRIAIPIKEDRGMKSTVNPQFGQTPYFLFVDIEEDKIQSWMTRQNPALQLKRKRGVTIAKLLTEEGTTTLLTNEMGETPLHILRDSFIELYKLPNNPTVAEAIKNFQDGRLERIEHLQEEKQLPQQLDE